MGISGNLIFFKLIYNTNVLIYIEEYISGRPPPHSMNYFLIINIRVCWLIYFSQNSATVTNIWFYVNFAHYHNCFINVIFDKKKKQKLIFLLIPQKFKILTYRNSNVFQLSTALYYKLFCRISSQYIIIKSYWVIEFGLSNIHLSNIHCH